MFVLLNDCKVTYISSLAYLTLMSFSCIMLSLCVTCSKALNLGLSTKSMVFKEGETFQGVHSCLCSPGFYNLGFQNKIVSM